MALTALIVIVIIVAIVLLGLNALVSVSRPDTDKTSTYECGYDTVHGQTRAPFAISFYLVAVLFLAFDLEVATLLPLSTVMGLIGPYGF
jgi:NADH:ubiquinone oxidoreductase subunit 3 (subunit A)